MHYGDGGACTSAARLSGGEAAHQIDPDGKEEEENRVGREIGQTHLHWSRAARGPRCVPRVRGGGSENPGMPF